MDAITNEQYSDDTDHYVMNEVDVQSSDDSNNDAAYQAKDEPSEAARHWVQDLFPPMFGYTEKELIEGPELLEEHGLLGEVARKRSASNQQSDDLFFQLAQVMSETDAATIRNVYRRVWVLMRLKEKQARDNKTTTQSNKGAEQPVDLTPSTSQTSTNKPSTIWTDDELEILRREFRATKDSNQSLLSEISFLKEDLKSSKSREMALTSEVRELKEQLGNVTKANLRFQIVVENLKKSLDNEIATTKALREEIKELKIRVKKKDALLRLKQKDFQEGVVHRTKLERSLEEMRVVSEHLEEDLIMRLRKEWIGKVHRLEDIASEAVEKLEEEKNAHQRTNKALESLRVHFSSFPISLVDTEYGKDSQEQVSYRKGSASNSSVNNDNGKMKDKEVEILRHLVNKVVHQDEITEWTY